MSMGLKWQRLDFVFYIVLGWLKQEPPDISNGFFIQDAPLRLCDVSQIQGPTDFLQSQTIQSRNPSKFFWKLMEMMEAPICGWYRKSRRSPELPCIQRSMFVTYFLDPKL